MSDELPPGWHQECDWLIGPQRRFRIGRLRRPDGVMNYSLYDFDHPADYAPRLLKVGASCQEVIDG